MAVESARFVQSKTQLWRYIQEISISPLLAALKESLRMQEDVYEGECDLLRSEAVEAILHLMNIAMDLVRTGLSDARCAPGG